MSFNVFAWIREGVRQSVLMGVTDALEDIGPSPDGDDMKARLHTAVMRRAEAFVDGPTTTTAKPKRLGRSLKDLDLADNK